MAASKPTSWLSKHSHLLYTIVQIWGPYTTVWTLLLLAMKLRSHCLTPEKHYGGIWSLLELDTLRPQALSVLYLPQASYSRLALKLFQREPAITQFDWNFSSTHKSSERFAALNGSILQYILLYSQSAHG